MELVDTRVLEARAARHKSSSLFAPIRNAPWGMPLRGEGGFSLSQLVISILLFALLVLIAATFINNTFREGRLAEGRATVDEVNAALAEDLKATWATRQTLSGGEAFILDNCETGGPPPQRCRTLSLRRIKANPAGEALGDEFHSFDMTCETEPPPWQLTAADRTAFDALLTEACPSTSLWANCQSTPDMRLIRTRHTRTTYDGLAAPTTTYPSAPLMATVLCLDDQPESVRAVLSTIHAEGSPRVWRRTTVEVVLPKTAPPTTLQILSP